jgi:hypothetical protein
MNYNDITLLGLGLAGVLLHCLIKIGKLKKTNSFKATKYFSSEWVTMAISGIVVAIAIACKHEVMQLEQAGKWLGLAFVAIGYMGQSILVTVMGKAENILKSKEQ